MKEIKDNKTGISIFILTIIVVGIGISFAYYSAVVHGTGNTNAETSANTATLGEVEFNGENTFDTTNIGRDIYPGFIGVQSFTVGPYKNGVGIYEIDLEANVPAAFGNDVKLTLYKTSDVTNNNIDSEEGTLTIVNNRYTKQDTLIITGTLEKVYEGSLVQTDETMLEQVEFVIANNVFTTPDVTPDGYYTYYAVYEYLDNGNQNSQQGLDFDSKITVKYISELYTPESEKTLNHLLDLGWVININIEQPTEGNPNFAYSPDVNSARDIYSCDVGEDTIIAYADDYTYNTTTGVYTLVNYTTCEYKDCYTDLYDKYVIGYMDDEGILPGTNGEATGFVCNMGIDDQPDIQSDENSYWYIMKITEAFLEYLDGPAYAHFDAIAYYGSSLYDIDEGNVVEQTNGLYSATDDYGLSYYIRGKYNDNYVKFGTWQTDYYNGYVSSSQKYVGYTSEEECSNNASSCEQIASAGDDMYWKIVRINGDGSIRLFYIGTDAWTEEGIGLAEYKIFTTMYDDNNAYVGYMYGTPGSNSYEETHANTNDSPIKEYVDAWYSSQMQGYASNITDTLFCNDRSIASSETINYVNTHMNGSYTSNGYNQQPTLYAPYGRQIEQSKMKLGNKATLKCPQKNDAFTVSDTTKGNGALTYPVGLITADEVNMMGVLPDVPGEVWYNTSFWTMSPAEVNGITNIYIQKYFDSRSVSSLYKAFPDGAFNVNPVINIKGDVLNAGDGTDSNPFRIE